MVESKGTKTFDIISGKPSQKVSIKINEANVSAENLALTTWGSSYMLANRLHTLDISQTHGNSQDIQVLELGAGTGLLGLSAAAIWHANVVLTDLDPIVPGLLDNIELNKEILHQHSAGAVCGTLDWNFPAELSIRTSNTSGQMEVKKCEDSKASIILAADTVYWEEHPQLLCKAIFAWLKHGQDSKVIIAYPMRVAYLDAIRDLWTLLEEGGLEAVQDGREEIHEDWDDEILHEWSVWQWKHTNE